MKESNSAAMWHSIAVLYCAYRKHTKYEKRLLLSLLLCTSLESSSMFYGLKNEKYFFHPVRERNMHALK